MRSAVAAWRNSVCRMPKRVLAQQQRERQQRDAALQVSLQPSGLGNAPRLL